MPRKIINVPSYKILNEKVLDFDDYLGDDHDELDQDSTSLQDVVSMIDFEDAKQKAIKWLAYHTGTTEDGVDVVYEFVQGNEKQLVVNSRESVILPNRKIERFPFKWGTIVGNFNVSNNKLTSFTNFPARVEGWLNANMNFIRDFSGLETSIGLELIASKQKCKTKYALSDDNYKIFKKNGDASLLENRVEITSGNSTLLGTLVSINESAGHCDVKLDDIGDVVRASLKDVYSLSLLFQ